MEHDEDDIQLRAEMDRTLVAGLIWQLAPQFRKNKEGAVEAWERLEAAVKCLYGVEHGGPVPPNWCEIMLITNLVRDIQAQCSDLAHAQEILRLLRFTINWQYQPGVQGKAPFEGYFDLKVVGGWGAALLVTTGLQVLDFLAQFPP